MNQENRTRLTLALSQLEAFDVQCEDESYTDTEHAWTVLNTFRCAVTLALGNDFEPPAPPPAPWGIEVKIKGNWTRICPTNGPAYVFCDERSAEQALRLCYDAESTNYRCVEL